MVGSSALQSRAGGPLPISPGDGGGPAGGPYGALSIKVPGYQVLFGQSLPRCRVEPEALCPYRQVTTAVLRAVTTGHHRLTCPALRQPGCPRR